MQNDLAANYPQFDIHILGVNEAGLEAGNALTTAGRDIPWLQDVDGNHDGWSDVWTSWDVAYRDVIILDAENAKVGTFNLSSHDLQVPADYNALRQMFIDVAVPEPSSISLVGIAAIALLVYAWRKRRRG